MNQTILNGNIGDAADDSDNLFHLDKGNLNAILDDFHGPGRSCRWGDPSGYGGGMFNWSHDALAIIHNTTFTSNYARDGGAIFNFQDCYACF